MAATGSNAIDDLWEGDLLDRKTDAEFLLTSLIVMSETHSQSVGGSYVMNVDADWGFGKTYFVKRFAKHVKLEGHKAVYIDAWKDDYDSDPFTSVISTMQELVEQDGALKKSTSTALQAVTQSFGKLTAAVVSGVGQTLLKRYVGLSVDSLRDILNEGGLTDEEILEKIENTAGGEINKIIEGIARKRIDNYRAAKEANDHFSLNFQKFTDSILGEDGGKRLFVIIDELDRCRPLYAIEMLERIKHLFDVDRVIFVLATNTKQLAHSVRAVYGAGFDGDEYLGRFFNRTYHLRNPQRHDILNVLWGTFGVDDSRFQNNLFTAREITVDIIEARGMSYRKIERLVDVISLFTRLWPANFPAIDPIMLPLIASAFVEQVDVLSDVANVDKYLAPQHSNRDWKRKRRTRDHYNVEVDLLTYIRARVTNIDKLFDEYLAERNREYGDISWRNRRSKDDNRDFIDKGIFSEGAHREVHRDAVGLGEKSAIHYYLSLIKQAGRLT